MIGKKDINVYRYKTGEFKDCTALTIKNHTNILTDEELSELSDEIKGFKEIENILTAEEVYKISMKVRDDGTVGLEAKDGTIRSNDESNLEKRIEKIENTLLNIELNNELHMKVLKFNRQLVDINIRLLRLESKPKEMRKIHRQLLYCPLCGSKDITIVTNIESGTKEFVRKCKNCKKLFVITIYEEGLNNS